MERQQNETYYDASSRSVIELERLYEPDNEEALHQLIELLVCRVRYYRRQEIFSLTYVTKQVINTRGRRARKKIETHTIVNQELNDEVVDLIWWIADHFPKGKFPYRIDVIKNQLHLCLGLDNPYLRDT